MTKEEFEAFLGALDSDRERAGEQYEQIRRKLVTFFRGRGVINVEDAVDETIDRVAKKLLEGEVIHNVKAFLLGVARKVASECVKKQKKAVPLIEATELHGNAINYEKEQERHRLERCLHKSLGLLLPEHRELIWEYHSDDGEKMENRRRLAAKRSCTLATLRVQAFKVRQKLRQLVEECMRRRASAVQLRVRHEQLGQTVR